MDLIVKAAVALLNYSLAGFINSNESQSLVEGECRGIVRDDEQPGNMLRIDHS